VIWEDGSDFRAVEGSLTAYLDDRDHSVPELIAGLDEVAAALISEVNALHQGGYGLDNSTGLDFFTGTDALSIGLSGDISDPRSIAAASAASSPGDSSLAGQIADLRHQELLSAGSATFTSYYADQVAGLARQIQEAGSESQNIDLVIQSLQSQRDRVSSVSLDQEAANLIKSQRAFEAAARMATAVDEMLDRIINGMGLVGR
jgi:flagellar hook-associated protein 1 FlgK